MQKIKTFDMDGRERSEKETCFPAPYPKNKREGAGTR